MDGIEYRSTVPSGEDQNAWVVNLRRCKARILTPVSVLFSFTRELRIREAETHPQASLIISILLGCTLDLPPHPKRTLQASGSNSRLEQ